MKCPFCGYESREQLCEKCQAIIPAEKSETKPMEEPKAYRRVKKDNKE